MKIVYTKHAADKFQDKEVIKLGIKREHINRVLKNPLAEDKNIIPHQSVGKFSNELSLSVIWKMGKDAIIVITFYPAGKGRYESKILQRR